ncbi:hypothetical protein BpHYR1_027295 [Brachionus plicatilis]|uniref:Uncharacterized protein n=1 Tax=Brachionus plicatilis TaxID=10195 RepID=A0A3M7P379_BRAPC|nr:hypothetical protein BpHYR1_027295 [Brachionus plicatilis]
MLTLMTRSSEISNHKNFSQFLLHLDQLKEFFSESGYINRPHRSRLTARNLEATTNLHALDNPRELFNSR